MTFFAAVASGIRNYATFRGRASLSEWSSFSAFCGITLVVAIILDNVIGIASPSGGDMPPTGALFVISILILLLPAISVSIRRLHDTNRSGWWYWIVVFPVIIGLLLDPRLSDAGFWDIVLPGLVSAFLLRIKGMVGENRFGPDPLTEAFANSNKSVPNIPLLGTDKTNQLMKLKALLDSGAISQEEFQKLKQNILNA